MNKVLQNQTQIDTELQFIKGNDHFSNLSFKIK